MFKRLGSGLKRRADRLSQFQKVHVKTTDTVAIFLQEKFGTAQGVLQYHWKADALWIQTSSKVFASELTLCLPEFSQYLRDRGVPVSRIVIQ